jgi:hypothetical protein
MNGEHFESRYSKDSSVRGKESSFTLEQKVSHIKAARDKKIAAIELESGRKLSDEEKVGVTLTIREYDQYRDKRKSLLGGQISATHTWNHALEQAGIPITKKHGLGRSPSDVYSEISEFRKTFFTANGREPEYKDFQEARRTGQIAGDRTIKSFTRSRNLGELLIAMGFLQQNQIKRSPEK